MPNVFTDQAMPGVDDEHEWFILEVEGTLQFLLVLIESYKESLITKDELVHSLIEFLNNKQFGHNE